MRQTPNAGGAAVAVVRRPRFYDPTIGRFTSLDAFAGLTADPQSLHKYAYCYNSPVDRIDPSGNYSLSGLCIASGIGAALGGIGGATLAHLTDNSVWQGALAGAVLGAVTGAGAYLIWHAIAGMTVGSLSRFFYDPRTFKTISHGYWQRFSTPHVGRSLHHWLIPQKCKSIPVGIRNAGFNLLNMPKILQGNITLNTWMGFAINWGGRRALAAMFTTWGVRILIPASVLGAYHATRWAANEVTEDTIDLMDGATATPLKFSPAEERQFLEEMGSSLEQARDAEER
ncbi:MAG: RHS repeat-associated core domain-containing protein [Planctomycetota bacterium]